MKVISGTKVSSMPTPAIRPSTNSPCSQPSASPTAASRAVAPSETGPLNSESSASWNGAATVMVTWNTTHITPRKSSGPITGAVAQRSIRSDRLARAAPASVVAEVTAAAIQPKRSSSAARESAVASVRARAGSSSLPSPERTVAASASSPVRRRGSMPTTGQPSACASAPGSTVMPRRAATSSMVRATTTRWLRSRTCETR